MLPKWHILIGLIFSIIALLIFPQISIFGAVVIFISSVCIDMDHYLYYSLRYNDWNLKNAYNWFIEENKKWIKLSEKQKNQYKRIIFILHGIECLIVLSLLMFFNKIFLFILMGFIIHLILDYIDLYNKKEPFYIKVSQILNIKRNKNKKFLDL